MHHLKLQLQGLPAGSGGMGPASEHRRRRGVPAQIFVRRVELRSIRLDDASILPGDLVWVNKLAYDLKVPFSTRHLVMGRPAARRCRGILLTRRWSPAGQRVIGLPATSSNPATIGSTSTALRSPMRRCPRTHPPRFAARSHARRGRTCRRPHPVQILPPAGVADLRRSACRPDAIL